MVIFDRFAPRPEETRLLIAKADPDLREGLREFFQMKNYDVVTAGGGPQASDELTSADGYDTAVLGVRLPEREGFAVLREARRQGVETPVIVLSTLSKSEHKVRAFQMGADDYVTMPFDINELAARVRAVLRRGKKHDSSKRAGRTDSFGALTIDLQERTVTENGEELGLTETEFSILECLLRNRGRPVSREKLLREVWALEGEVDTRRLSRHVASLRRKIESDPEAPTYLQTVRGVGYKFTG
jgi:DNA-binding response OmpR family regulator